MCFELFPLCETSSVFGAHGSIGEDLSPQDAAGRCTLPDGVFG
jgi:hypothetical protein